MPEKFTYEGKEYTPAVVRRIAADRHGRLHRHSRSLHPPPLLHGVRHRRFPTTGCWGTVWNLPLDEIMTVIDNALANGYTDRLGHRREREGFQPHQRPSASSPRPTLRRHGAAPKPRSWGKLTQKEKDDALYKFDKPGKERTITQEMRQEALRQLRDHRRPRHADRGHGRRSERQRPTTRSRIRGHVRPPYDGYWYFSRPFVEYKTTSIMVNKNALPKETAKRLGLK